MQNTASSKKLNNDLESKVKGLEKEKQTLLKDAKALAQSKKLEVAAKISYKLQMLSSRNVSRHHKMS